MTPSSINQIVGAIFCLGFLFLGFVIGASAPPEYRNWVQARAYK